MREAAEDEDDDGDDDGGPPGAGRASRAVGRRRLAECLYEALVGALSRGRPEVARSLLDAIEVLWPRWRMVPVAVAAVLWMERRYDEALHAVRDSDLTMALALRAGCLAMQRDPGWVGVACEVVRRGDSTPSEALVLSLVEHQRVVHGTQVTLVAADSPSAREAPQAGAGPVWTHHHGHGGIRA